jgi:hypothetical protein
MSPENTDLNGPEKRKRSQRPSKAYLRFESVIKRSLNLLTLQVKTKELIQVSNPNVDIDLTDMSRASIVLSVAAMDAYFTDVFVERLVPFIKKKGPTKSLTDFLNQAGLDTACALQLLTMKRPFRRIRKLVESHLETVTTQKFEAIDRLVGVYNFKDFSTNVAKYSKKGDRLLLIIKQLVVRRHRIAHEGDLNMHGKPKQIEASDVRRRINAVVLFVAKSDELLHRQLNS